MNKRYDTERNLTLHDLNEHYSAFGQTFDTQDQAKEHARNYPGSQIHRIMNYVKNNGKIHKECVAWLVRKIDARGNIIKPFKSRR